MLKFFFFTTAGRNQSALLVDGGAPTREYNITIQSTQGDPRSTDGCPILFLNVAYAFLIRYLMATISNSEGLSD